MIYFVQAEGGGPVKIGYTSGSDVRKRLGSLQTGSPFPLHVLAVIKGGPSVEKEMHKRFAADRLHGEWFRPSEEMVLFLGKKLRTDELGLARLGFEMPRFDPSGQVYRPSMGREPLRRHDRRLLRPFLTGEWLRPRDIARFAPRHYSENGAKSWASGKLTAIYKRGWLVRREQVRRVERRGLLVDEVVIEFALRLRESVEWEPTRV